MTSAGIRFNDVILGVAFFCAALLLISEWHFFAECPRPLHMWLLVSYFLGGLFRMMHHIGARTAPEGKEFLLHLRPQKLLPRALLIFTWTLLLPIFTVWNVLGSFWLKEVLNDAPQCLPESTPSWYVIVWQCLCHLWSVVHIIFGIIACTIERRLRLAERDIRAVEDDDTLARWGPMTSYPDYALTNKQGLHAGDIDKLPVSTWQCDDGDDASCSECPICLNQFENGDVVRMLPNCGHVFHKPCIDLWMLRCALCPLCKCEVKAS